mmetsp:Transcript_17493/g.48804  ORF Transcript_17493/g.48804 Transcript_17493/m.48804 type:complete len:241 (+) Transcript_17493:3980-4702(+)
MPPEGREGRLGCRGPRPLPGAASRGCCGAAFHCQKQHPRPSVEALQRREGGWRWCLPSALLPWQRHRREWKACCDASPRRRPPPRCGWPESAAFGGGREPRAPGCMPLPESLNAWVSWTAQDPLPPGLPAVSAPGGGQLRRASSPLTASRCGKPRRPLKVHRRLGLRRMLQHAWNGASSGPSTCCRSCFSSVQTRPRGLAGRRLVRSSQSCQLDPQSRWRGKTSCIRGHLGRQGWQWGGH